MTDLPSIHLDDLDDAIADAEARERVLPPPGTIDHAIAVRELAEIAAALSIPFDLGAALATPLPDLKKQMLFRAAARRLH